MTGGRVECFGVEYFLGKDSVRCVSIASFYKVVIPSIVMQAAVALGCIRPPCCPVSCTSDRLESFPPLLKQRVVHRTEGFLVVQKTNLYSLAFMQPTGCSVSKAIKISKLKRSCQKQGWLTVVSQFVSSRWIIPPRGIPSEATGTVNVRFIGPQDFGMPLSLASRFVIYVDVGPFLIQ